MADIVQQRLEAGLEELDALTQRRVLSEEETRQILRKRRSFEFDCTSRHGDTVKSFLLYIQYEVNLLTLLRLRCRAAVEARRSRLEQLLQQQRLHMQRQMKKNKQEKRKNFSTQRLDKLLYKDMQQRQQQEKRILRAKDLIHAVTRTGSRRVYKLCIRLLQRHSTSLALWYSCLDLLLQLGSTRQLQQLLLRALRQFPSCSGLWILAADRLLQHGQLLAARRLLLTALRFNGNSVILWTELLRLEAAAALRKAKALYSQREEHKCERKKGNLEGKEQNHIQYRHQQQNKNNHIILDNNAAAGDFSDDVAAAAANGVAPCTGGVDAAAASVAAGAGAEVPAAGADVAAGVADTLLLVGGGGEGLTQQQQEETVPKVSTIAGHPDVLKRITNPCQTRNTGEVIIGKEDGKEEEEHNSKQQVRGDAVMVVLKAAVEKLSRRKILVPGSTAGAETTVALVKEEDTIYNSDSRIHSKLLVAAANSRLEDFLIRALELCLWLQASDAASAMQQQLLLPLQHQISLLLHEQAQRQPLLRVYEWKILLLQAVAADFSEDIFTIADSQKEKEDEQSSSSSSTRTNDSSSSNSSNGAVPNVQVDGPVLSSNEKKRNYAEDDNFIIKGKSSVLQKTLENILEECKTEPHLLLLLALFLHALYCGSNRSGSNSSSTLPNAAVTEEMIATEETENITTNTSAASVVVEQTSGDVLCFFDVEGDADDESERGVNILKASSTGSKKASGRHNENAVATELRPGSQLLQRYGGAHADADLCIARNNAAALEGRDETLAASKILITAHAEKEASLLTSNTPTEKKETSHDTMALQQLEMLSEFGWPQILFLLQRQPRIGRACLLLLLHADNMKDTSGACGGGGAATATDLLAEPLLLQLQRETLWAALWGSTAASSPRIGGREHTLIHRKRLWLMEVLYKALQHIHEQHIHNKQRHGHELDQVHKQQQQQVHGKQQKQVSKQQRKWVREQKQQQQRQQREATGTFKDRRTQEEGRGHNKGTTTVAAAGAVVALGQLLLGLLESAAAHMRTNVSVEVPLTYGEFLQQLHGKLQQLVESFLELQHQRQKREENLLSPASREQHQRQVAQLLLLLMKTRQSSPDVAYEQQQQHLHGEYEGQQYLHLLNKADLKKLKQTQELKATEKKRLYHEARQQHEEKATSDEELQHYEGKATSEEEREQLEDKARSGAVGAAALRAVLRQLKKGSLRLSEAEGLLQQCLECFSSSTFQSSPSTSERRGCGQDIETTRDINAVELLLPTWFVDLLAATTASALPALVKRYCQRGLFERQQQLLEQLYAQQHEDVARWLEKFVVSEQPLKRRKLLHVHTKHLQSSSNTLCEVLARHSASAAAAGATATPAVVATDEDAERRTKANFRVPVDLREANQPNFVSASPFSSHVGAAADMHAMADIAAALQWSRVCTPLVNDDCFCVRLCSAARLTVLIELCEFTLQALWGSIVHCWSFALAPTSTVRCRGWLAVLRVLLRQCKEVYACALAAFDRSGLKQQLLLHEEKRGRGRRLVQQEAVLRQHILQHMCNAREKQVRWWLDFWRFCRFCEEARALMQVQQMSMIRNSKAIDMLRPEKTSGLTANSSAETSAGGGPATFAEISGDISAPTSAESSRDFSFTTFVLVKREEAERQAEQALGEGSAALAAFREALAAEIAAPCEPQQHYPRGCTVCGLNRIWCTYTATAQSAVNTSFAASA